MDNNPAHFSNSLLKLGIAIKVVKSLGQSHYSNFYLA
jgi:hypothetical protein